MSLFGEGKGTCGCEEGLLASVYDEEMRTTWDDFARHHRMRVPTECALLKAAERLAERTECDNRTEVEVAR
jgi:hypothetical protein